MALMQQSLFLPVAILPLVLILSLFFLFRFKRNLTKSSMSPENLTRSSSMSPQNPKDSSPKDSSEKLLHPSSLPKLFNHCCAGIDPIVIVISPIVIILFLVILSFLLGGLISYGLYIIIKTGWEFNTKIELFWIVTLPLFLFSLLFLFTFKRFSNKLAMSSEKLKAFGELLRRSLLRDLSNQYGPVIPPMVIVLCLLLLSLVLGLVIGSVLYIIIKTCWNFHLMIEVMGFQFDHPRQANALLQSLLQCFQEQRNTKFFLPIALSLLLVPVYFLFSWFKKTSPKLPPSPPKLPIIGNFHQLGEFLQYFLRDLSSTYGPLMSLRLGNVNAIVVSSAEMAKEITTTHDLVLANRPATTATKTFLYGLTDVNFAPYGENWTEVRKFCDKQLFNEKRVHIYKLIREQEVRGLVEKIKSSGSTDGAANLTEMLSTLANNLISRVVFGKIYEQESGKSSLRELTRDVLTLMGTFSVGEFYPRMGWVDELTGWNGRMKHTFNTMDNFLNQVIEDHSNDKSKGDADLVDVLLRAKEDSSFTISLAQDNIKSIILDMFLAGVGTISSITEWAMVELRRNPDIMIKAQEEVRKVILNKYHCKNCANKAPPVVAEEDTQNMTFLKCIVKEILRLHPNLPLVAPQESTETLEIQGYHIPAKTSVLVNAWAIQRDPKVWNDSEEFKPDRFMNNPINSNGFDFDYLPPGAGARIWPGRSFSLIASQVVLANLLFWFNWDLSTGSFKEDLHINEPCTIYKKNIPHLVQNGLFVFP